MWGAYVSYGLLLLTFIVGMWVAHKLDKARAFFDKLPCEDLPRSRALADASRQEYGVESPTVNEAIKQRALADRLERGEKTAWEKAHHREVWEAFCAQEDAKRRRA